MVDTEESEWDRGGAERVPGQGVKGGREEKERERPQQVVCLRIGNET